MPARAHRRAPDHLAGAVPNPPCRGPALIRPPHQSPRSLAPRGRWPPSTPLPPKPFGELANPGRCPPRVHPGPRASRAGFASPPLHLPSTPPAGAANSPAAPTGAPRPPSQGREAPPAALARGRGRGDRRRRMVTRGDRRAGGSYREGHPARAPTVRSPAMPASLTQRNAATLADPHSLSPGPSGPGRFYTDSPTPFGV
ncbi:hypothetical protein N7530_010719 [Penicillium desertorum]|uniref:Uncharacterized protein n=1 Tax=Penicillium desertorum TaxID=1303715 RepID=A0A9W9WGA4_9EURO|nr:hypothetical protein N7530_010719 [Penicillium desertorum]